jgi:hypothetical protein
LLRLRLFRLGLFRLLLFIVGCLGLCVLGVGLVSLLRLILPSLFGLVLRPRLTWLLLSILVLLLALALVLVAFLVVVLVLVKRVVVVALLLLVLLLTSGRLRSVSLLRVLEEFNS